MTSWNVHPFRKGHLSLQFFKIYIGVSVLSLPAAWGHPTTSLLAQTGSCVLISEAVFIQLKF